MPKIPGHCEKQGRHDKVAGMLVAASIRVRQPRRRAMMENNRTDIHIPFPDAMDRHLRIRVGACRLKITRGASPEWVTGTYDDPTGSMGCRVTQEGGAARITQEPRIVSPQRWGRGVPAFNLSLGTALPYTLTIETGASDSEFELGGLPLTRLALKLGAGKNVTRFLEPNPQTIGVLDLDAGACNMELRGLANANFADLTLDGGAAAFICDFGGNLKRDAAAHLNTGMSTLEIIVPATTAARIVSEPVLGRLDASDGFVTRDGGYWTRPAAEGGTPVLTIHANVALGTLALRTLPQVS
jgi:hypothetical protein